MVNSHVENTEQIATNLNSQDLLLILMCFL